MKSRFTLAAKLSALMLTAILFSGCATNRQPYDYTAFKASRPKSILVLPPLNNSPDVNATYGMLSQVTQPLAEGGYYVMPVALVAETFKQNGMTAPADVHSVPLDKMREIFGADAVLYITVTKYGAVYTVLNSAAIVSADAKLVDIRTGQTLWMGSAAASSSESENNSNSGGLVGLLITAVIKQIVHNVADTSHNVAGITSHRLLAAGVPNGLLYGPRSPNYGKD